MSDANRSIEEIAALEFEAWPADIIDEFNADACNERFSNLGVNLRIAAQFLIKTKPEMTRIARELGETEITKTLDYLRGAAEQLQALYDMAEAAETHLLIGAAVVALEEG